MYSRYALRRWHMLTWMVFLIWLWFGIGSNVPQRESFESLSKHIEDMQRFTGRPASAASTYSYTVSRGWPLTYQKRTITDPPKTVRTTFHWPKLVANLTAGLLVQFSIVYSLQQLPQFNFRTLMCSVSCLAAMLTAGRIFAAESDRCFVNFILLTYFLPAIAAVLVAISKRRSQLDAIRYGRETQTQP